MTTPDSPRPAVSLPAAASVDIRLSHTIDDQCSTSLAGQAAPEEWPPAVPVLARPVGTVAQDSAATPSLAELTTLHVGGPVRDYREVHSEAEFIDAVRSADEQGQPLLVIGGGSNILATDEGFDGVVVRDARQHITLASDDRCGGVEFTATAGTSLDDVVREAIASEWAGFAPLSGIPGTIGAAPVQNVGAYGTEMAELIASVRAWDRLQQRPVHMPLANLHLSYRDSILKASLRDEQAGGGRLWGPTGRWVVLSVTFAVRQASLSAPIAYEQLASALGVPMGTRVDARAVRDAVLDLRRSKGMVLDPENHDTWSAGSFFTNPIITEEQAAALPEEAPRFPVADHSRVVAGTRAAPVIEGLVKTSAAWLIDHAGFSRGFRICPQAPASLSTAHVLALTNRGGACAADILALRDTVVDGVRERFGITLVPEPVTVGGGTAAAPTGAAEPATSTVAPDAAAGSAAVSTPAGADDSSTGRQEA